MSLFSRGAARLAARTSPSSPRSSLRPLQRQSQRRYDSHSAHDSHGAHGAEESALHVDSGAGTGSEGFGASFYVALSLIPLGLVAYTFSTSGTDIPVITRLISANREREETNNRRAMLNEAAVEQAALDRHLFTTAEQDRSGPTLEFPEIFNTGSPWNVAAGQQGANLTALMEHYTEVERQAEAARLQRMKDGKVSTVYDDTTGGRLKGLMGFEGTAGALGQENKDEKGVAGKKS